MRNRFQKYLSTAMMVIVAAGVIGATETPPATSPTTAPATRPSGFPVRGHVTLSGGLSLQKPDLSRVVIYLASDPTLDAIPSAANHATVAQKNKAFVPNFTVVPRGMDVEFPNCDNFDHNVFSRSKAAPAFDLDRYPRGQSKSRIFDKVGVVQIFCNIHPSMRAIIFVTPNTYFTSANADGAFELTDVPPGHYELVAWHERCGETRQTIDVKAGDSPDVLFALSENHQNVMANDLTTHDSSYGVERGLGIKREKLDLPVVKESHASLDAGK